MRIPRLTTRRRNIAEKQNELGQHCYEGYGESKQDYEAARLFQLAAKRGHAGAQNNLGWCYLEGRGVPQNLVEDARLFRLAALQRNLEAQFNLAAMLENGQGVPQDIAEAYNWFWLASNRCRTADEARDRIAVKLTAEKLSIAEKRLAKMFEKLGTCE